MKVTLGVTGCIAAYKSALILRLLEQAGCEVFPVMTKAAEEFIGPLTLEKLSGNRVVRGMFDPSPRTDIEHISLARETDLLLVAPATANLLAKFAQGICDDFLTTLYVSGTTPVIVAPGMNIEMWRHPATERNLDRLRGDGVEIIEPESGYLACGEVGEGRLAEPARIVESVVQRLGRNHRLQGMRVLVTAGPTVEDLDPVRFLSNRSSGKMGYAIAAEAERRGAQVTLVSGPTSLSIPRGVDFLPVRSATDMETAVTDRFALQDIVVMAAAVSDFRARRYSKHKIKKKVAGDSLELERNPDILADLGSRKKGQILVGFAAESEDRERNAARKLLHKNLDLLVANDITRRDAGFAADTNQAVVLGTDGFRLETELLSKAQLSSFLWDQIERLIVSRASSPVDAALGHSPRQDP